MDSSIFLTIIIFYIMFYNKVKITKKTREILVILFYVNLIAICALSFYVDEHYDSKNPQ